ncbi:DUF6042 family protein [Paenibacillus sp. Soil787]|uniref:DUF6042 family protein n=1 Tax=Paenibacillus sp. Soil787 TaxID=1736411 RepID=UPI0006FDD129|nr:DUF6042 family protein [Paenibacillus sp. Soil787]KRF31704.1 hypothetical protein ASG93_05035 [Paenibacillus sp. Soil787]
MYTGKITVSQLSQLKMIPDGQCIIPQSIYDYGWLACLPIVNIITLPQISNCIALDFSKDSIIDYLIRNNDKDLFWKFQNKNSHFISKSEMSEYNLYSAREQNIANRLEKNGFVYPCNMQEVIGLFIKLGIMIECPDNQSEIKMDLIILPFPKPDTLLGII